MKDQIEAASVDEGGKLIDAMWALERALEIALVVGRERRLLGVCTDGDLRRAMLNGCSPESPLAPIANRRFVSVLPDARRGEVLELMQARTIAQVPVVDAQGRLVGLHLLRELIGAQERPNWAVVMAGGRGTRLGALTKKLPKPMIQVAGRPILERIVLHLISFGVRRVFLSINYLGHLIEEHFGDGSRLGCQIEYLREDRPLGTAGALRLLPESPLHPVVVMNGDLVTQANLGGVIDFHERGGQLGTMAIRRYVHTVPFGCLTLSGDRILGCEEKPQLIREINAGIYVVQPELLQRIPVGVDYGMPQLFTEAAARGDLLRAFEIEDDWIDVGQRDQLLEAQGSVHDAAN